MNCRIEYNKALEFVNALFKYSVNVKHRNILSSNEIKEDIAKEIHDFSPSKEVKEWLNYVDNNISPFFRNDMLLILNKIDFFVDVLTKIVLKNNIENPIELIQKIREMDSLELLELIYDEYNLSVPFNSDDEIIKKILSEQIGKETAVCFMQAKHYPKEYHDKSVYMLETFYTCYYQPFEDKVYAFMEKKLKEHNKLFEKNNIEFLNTIGLGDYSKIIYKCDLFRVFVSYYIDLGVFHYNIDNTFVMLYGHTIENRFNNKINIDKAKNIFKSLADETRLEIIRITSQRPWYNKELADYFNLSTATLSYHLNLLFEQDILNFEPSINNRYYYKTDKENLIKLLNSAIQNLLENKNELEN